jgi:hypothetical protein
VRYPLRAICVGCERPCAQRKYKLPSGEFGCVLVGAPSSASVALALKITREDESFRVDPLLLWPRRMPPTQHKRTKHRSGGRGFRVTRCISLLFNWLRRPRQCAPWLADTEPGRGRKWTVERRIDNCKAPIDRRGTRPRSSTCPHVLMG